MSIRRGAIERRASDRFGLLERLDRPQCVEGPVPESAWADGADELLDTLPADQREAVRLRVLDELEYADIARELGTTPGASARPRPPWAPHPETPSHLTEGEPLMTRLDLDPDLERLGDALRASAAVDLAREERAARSAAAGRGRLSAGARARRTRLGPRALAGSSLGLAGVGAALVLALSGSAAPPAFGKTALAVTRQHDGSVLVKVNLNSNKPWVLPADRKLAAMGIDEQIAVAYQPGAAGVRSPVSCTPLEGAATPAGPPVRVLFRMDGAQAGPSGNTGAGTLHVNSCVYYKSPRHRYTQAPPRHRYNGNRNTGTTGNG